jgi:hypothetical protein
LLKQGLYRNIIPYNILVKKRPISLIIKYYLILFLASIAGSYPFGAFKWSSAERSRVSSVAIKFGKIGSGQVLTLLDKERRDSIPSKGHAKVFKVIVTHILIGR